MNKPRLIEYMAQKREERHLNKPRYKIEDLYVGEIIYIVNTEFVSGPTFWQSGTKTTYKHIKPFAIFSRTCWEHDYLHILTNHPFRQSFHAEIGEYAVNHNTLKEFDKCMQRYMIANNLKSTSKLSINDIKELEDYVNEKLYPEHKKDKLFC